MKNPKTWSGPTPMSHSGKIAPSGLDSFAAPTKNGDRGWTGPTPANHSGKVVISSKPDLGKPRAKASDRSEMAPAKTSTPIAHSGPEPKNAEVVKWHKRGYNMGLPTALGSGDGKKPARNIG